MASQLKKPKQGAFSSQKKEAVKTASLNFASVFFYHGTVHRPDKVVFVPPL